MGPVACSGRNGSRNTAFERAAERAERLAVERADRADEVPAARREDRHLQAGLDRLGPGVGEEGVLEVARRDQRHEMREVRAQRVDQLLRSGSPAARAARAPPSRPSDGGGRSRRSPKPPSMSMNSLPLHVAEHRALVRPLHRRVVGRDRLAVLQEARVDVVVPVADRVLDDPLLLGGRQRLLADQLEDVRGFLARTLEVLGHGMRLLSAVSGGLARAS